MILLGISTEVFAALTNNSILETVVQQYKTAAIGWKDYMMDRATWLFFILALISMIWTFSQLLFHRSSFAEYAGELIRFCIVFGFFLWLLRNGPDIALDIIESFIIMGSQASGQPNVKGLSSIVDIGFSVFDRAINSTKLSDPAGSTGLIIIGATVLVIISLIAINMLILYCSGWILCYAGIIYLGLGGCRWTSDIAINYFKTVLGVAASLMTTILLIGIASNIFNQQVVNMSIETNMEEMGVLLVSAIALLFLVNKVPTMVAGIITGASIGAATGAAAFGGGFVGAAIGSSFGNVGRGMSGFATGLAAMGGGRAAGYTWNQTGGRAWNAYQGYKESTTGGSNNSSGLDTSKIGGNPSGSAPV